MVVFLLNQLVDLFELASQSRQSLQVVGNLDHRGFDTANYHVSAQLAHHLGLNKRLGQLDALRNHSVTGLPITEPSPSAQIDCAHVRQFDRLARSPHGQRLVVPGGYNYQVLYQIGYGLAQRLRLKGRREYQWQWV